MHYFGNNFVTGYLRMKKEIWIVQKIFVVNTYTPALLQVTLKLAADYY